MVIRYSMFNDTYSNNIHIPMFIYSEKATKFCEISTLLLTDTKYDKSKVEVSRKFFVAFSEHMNFAFLNRYHALTCICFVLGQALPMPPELMELYNLYKQELETRSTKENQFVEELDNQIIRVKFIYSEKATKFCEISTVSKLIVNRTNLRWRFRKNLWPSQNN